MRRIKESDDCTEQIVMNMMQCTNIRYSDADYDSVCRFIIKTKINLD